MSAKTRKEFFNTHPQIYSQFNRIVDHSGNYFEEILKQQYCRFAKTLFSIGCGQAELEMRLAKEFQLKLSLLEPSSSYVEGIKKLNSPYVNDLISLPFQHYEPKTKYDLVISIHSWYFIQLQKEPLEKALAMVAPGGKLFITIVSQKSFVREMVDLSSYANEPRMQSETLSLFCQKSNLTHRYFENIRTLPIENFVQTGQLQDSAKAFASFLHYTPWDKIDTSKQEEIRELFLAKKEISLICGCLEFSKR